MLLAVLLPLPGLLLYRPAPLGTDRRLQFLRAWAVFVAMEKIWIFGMNPEGWPTFLKEYGWPLIEDVDYNELAGRYMKPTGRILASTPVERIVYAEKL